MNTLNRTLIALVAIGLAGLAIQAASAANSCGCAACDSCSSCRGFECNGGCIDCQPTIEMKKVEEVVWECECKMVCMAGPSCGCNGVCGMSRQVKHLIRKIVTHEVPVTKCTASEGVACTCGAGQPAAAPEAEMPSAPLPAAPAPPSAGNGSQLNLDAFTLSNPVGAVTVSSRRLATVR